MFKYISFVLALLSIGLCSSVAFAACSKQQPTKPGEVYFMRGLANIFSLGLDTFSKEITEEGIRSCIYNHKQARNVVTEILARSKSGEISHPIVIVGHSLGAGVAPRMATNIGKVGIPVDYVVMLDPVEPTVVGANVVEIINYHLPKRKDNRLYPGKEFDGKLENINVKKLGGFDHFNIDENRNLRNAIKEHITELSAATETEDGSD